MKSLILLGALAIIVAFGSLASGDTPSVDESPRLPKLLPGYPEKIAVADVWKFMESQPRPFPGCTRRLRFEGKERTGSRVYYQAVPTKWRKGEERVTVTYVQAGEVGVITEVKIGDQNYYRDDRAEAFFGWDQRLPWER